MLNAKKVSLLLSYLVALGCFLALYEIADNTYHLFLLFLFLLGVLNEWRFHLYLPRWLLNGVGVVVSLIFLLELSLENPIKPFANMLLLLLAIKSLEEKKPRDIYQMLLLSLFGIAVSTTFRLDLSFLLFFLHELFIGSVAFIFTNAYANLGDSPLPKEFLKRYLGFSFIFPIAVAVITVPFFLILPRSQTPLFDLLVKKEEGLVSGIAEEVELGKVGDIQQDNSVVFRVYGEVPKDAYWRVSVFDTLLNTKWVSTIEEKENLPLLPKRAKLFKYTVILEPTYDTFLPVLDYPLRLYNLEGVRDKPLRLKGGYYEISKPVGRPVRYGALSVDKAPYDEPHPLYLEVPEDVPESIKDLALRLSRSATTNREKVRAVASFFSEGFSYSLKIEEFEGHPLEHFLFRSKRGNCEFFASSTALLLRLMGVPSRLVGGFKGYLKNEYGDYYIVTNSMAHVWVEAYVDGRWVRVDTTPYYVSPALRSISKIHLLRDALISFWYENVVDFSAQKQVSLLRGLLTKANSISLTKLGDTLTKLALIFGIAFFLYSAVSLYKNTLRKTPENLYKKLLKKLSRMERTSFEGYMPEEVLEAVAGKPYYGEVRFIVGIYQRHRFSPYKVSRRELEEGYRVLSKI
jgi:transglutaminase-like putative cysteine protease